MIHQIVPASPKQPSAEVPTGPIRCDAAMLRLLNAVPDLPHSVPIWSTVLPGMELPLQALRHCYAIHDVTEDDVFVAMTLPINLPVTEKNSVAAWEYRSGTNTILTTDKLLVAGLQARGRQITFQSFTVGLRASEVMEELEQSSQATLNKLKEMLRKRKATFQFRGCTREEGRLALERATKRGAFVFKDGILSCRNFLVALELVNISERTPTLVVKGQTFAH